MRLTEAALQDDDGGVLKLVWFNQPYMARQLPKGERVAVAGMVKGRYGMYEMRNPLNEKVSATGPKRLRDLMPRYHLVKGLSSKDIAQWIETVFRSRPTWRTSFPRTPSKGTTCSRSRRRCGPATIRRARRSGRWRATAWPSPSSSSCRLPSP